MTRRCGPRSRGRGAAIVHPAEGPLDDPASRQNIEPRLAYDGSDDLNDEIKRGGLVHELAPTSWRHRKPRSAPGAGALTGWLSRIPPPLGLASRPARLRSTMRARSWIVRSRNNRNTVCHGGKFTSSIRQPHPVRARYQMPFNTWRKSQSGDGRSSGASAEALQPATIPRLSDPSGNGGSSSRWPPPGPIRCCPHQKLEHGPPQTATPFQTVS